MKEKRMSLKYRRVAVAAVAAASIGAFGAPSAFAADDAPQINIDAPVDVAVPNGPTVLRIADRDRIGTAIEALQSRCWAGGNVILASSENFADALAAGPLADVRNAPILVTPNGDSLDPRVADALTDAYSVGGTQCPGFDKVTIVSGTGVLTSGVVDEIEDDLDLDTERFSGANRYQTSTVIGLAVVSDINFEGELNAGVDVFLADGDNFPDALAAGAAAAERNGVVLLTMGDRGIDDSVALATSLNGPYSGPSADAHRSIWAVGGNAAKAAAKGFQGGQPIEVNFSVVGADRYETAAKLARATFGNPKDFVVASGENYADGVVAGGYAANLDAPLLLTTSAALSKVTGDYLSEKVDNGERVIVFGGPGSVSKAVSFSIAESFNY
jgi:putative cell wall-binding protein